MAYEIDKIFWLVYTSDYQRRQINEVVSDLNNSGQTYRIGLDIEKVYVSDRYSIIDKITFTTKLNRPNIVYFVDEYYDGINDDPYKKEREFVERMNKLYPDIQFIFHEIRSSSLSDSIFYNFQRICEKKDYYFIDGLDVVKKSLSAYDKNKIIDRGNECFNSEEKAKKFLIKKIEKDLELHQKLYLDYQKKMNGQYKLLQMNENRLKKLNQDLNCLESEMKGMENEDV